jgi:hypothetical protein
MRSGLILAAICAVLLALGGCKSIKTGAREHFGKEFSCPDDRITIVERSDLKWGSIILDQNQPEPPTEIKGDPGRLAKWKEEKEKEKKDSRSTLDALDVFEGKGCDHSVLMGCGHSGNNEGGCDPSSVSCWHVEQDKKK